MKTSTKSVEPIIFFAISLSEIKGEIKEVITMVPVSKKSFAISATRRIFSVLSAEEKPKSLLIPSRVLSPSKQKERTPFSKRAISN